MDIPYQDISEEALDALIMQYITQIDGVDEVENPISTYYERVRQSVIDGELGVYYCRNTETACLTRLK